MPEPSRRILLIRPSALGDVCRSVPVLSSLKLAFPEASIDWLVRDSFAPAVAAHPALHRVVPFERARLGRAWRHVDPRPSLAFLRSLRGAGYDLVVDAQGLARSGLFAFATGARRRIGDANARELGWLGSNERYEVPRNLHTVDRMLELLRRAGIPPIPDMTLYPPEQGVEFARNHGFGHNQARFAILAPTSAWPSKRWPADRFAGLAASLLSSRLLERIAIVGAPGERDQCRPLIDLAVRDPRILDLVGRTDIAQLMGLIAPASLVVANDSAALHMAVGLQRAVVALFGPTHAELVGPYRRSEDVIQHLQPGDRLSHKLASTSMIERITLEEVIEACRIRLA